MKSIRIALLLWFLSINTAAAQYLTTAPQMVPPSSVYLEDLTWPEVRDFLNRGGSTIIIPTGGTEQNGPHMALGKHNAIVSYTSGEIARTLGNALVAPVLAYVPEGRINPPEGHMRFPGTISVEEQHFAAILEDAARSFKQHGFTNIVLLGDHGGSQTAMQQIALKLSNEWRTTPAQVLFVSDYYSNNGHKEWAQQQGIKADMTAHAGFSDTSQLMATDKRLVREHFIKPYSAKDAASFGVTGDPSGARSQHGAALLQLKIQAAVRQIRGMAQ